MFINTHIHTFRDVDVPRKFLPLGLVRILASKPGYFLIAKLLNNINPFSDNDILDRYIKFVRIGKLGSQTKIYENCKKYYPRDTKFVILSMDMAYMGAGKVPRDFQDQLEELGKLKIDFPEVIPFIHVDPRRDNVLDLLKRSVEEWGFKGVKLYPPLGYFPYDSRLNPVYDYCQNNKLQIIAHCSPYNPVHYKGSKKEIVRLLSAANEPVVTKGKNKKELCSNFSNPANYVKVLNDFKELKICLAHFGSEYMWEKYLIEPEAKNNWFVIIKDMLKTYPNLYSDISFTLNNQEFFPLLKVLLNNDRIKGKVLFGSDYYMVETKTNERRFCIDLRAYLGEANYTQIATTNPNKFLGLTS